MFLFFRAPSFDTGHWPAMLDSSRSSGSDLEAEACKDSRPTLNFDRSGTPRQPSSNQETSKSRGLLDSDSRKRVAGGDVSRTHRTHKHRKHCFTARSKGSKPKKTNLESGYSSEVVQVSETSGQVSNHDYIWRSPTQEERNSGAEILGRPIRVWWDGDGKWFTGVVVEHNPDPNAVDGHGNVGPTFTVRYDDGVFDENLEVRFLNHTFTCSGCIIC